MNIFATSDDPIKCATVLDDKRVIKMTLETAQILSTVINSRGIATQYKPTHKAHPCTLWALIPVNTNWLYLHFVALCNEYTFRFGRKHKCEELSDFFRTHLTLTNEMPSKFVHCNKVDLLKLDILNDYNNLVFESYKKTLVNKWKEDKRLPIWTNRGVPDFFDKQFGN